MSLAREVSVTSDEDGMRLDRWFKQHFPDLTHGSLQKLLRTGQVRVDGGRVKSNTRLADGQRLRLPPALAVNEPDGDGKKSHHEKRKTRKSGQPDELAREILGRVLYQDEDVLVIDKPAGLAVQGGSGVTRHLDGVLDALRFDASERPRLVHRLDKDTSGVLALARTRSAAQWLTRAFREKGVEKLYWAAVAGVPKPDEGEISLALEKKAGAKGRELVRGLETGSVAGASHSGAEYSGAAWDPAESEDESVVGDGRSAVTRYRVIERFGQRAAWLAMMPETGRTHQLRVHAASGLGTPILGDGKYAGAAGFPDGLTIPRKLHLHARRLILRTPRGQIIDVTAGLSEHMRKTWEKLGFEANKSADVVF